MKPSDKFRRFAAECEEMSNFAKSPESKSTWNGMAARWTLFAELAEDTKLDARSGADLLRVAYVHAPFRVGH
jgi:hypothetical protein